MIIFSTEIEGTGCQDCLPRQERVAPSPPILDEGGLYEKIIISLVGFLSFVCGYGL
jgi:hypothetical protein